MSRPCNCGRAQVGEPYTLDQCRPCWLFLNDAGYAAKWGADGGGTSKPKSTTVCRFRSPLPLTTLEKKTNHLAKCRDYYRCGHDKKPLGEFVCKQSGCGEPLRCGGYEAITS